MQVTSPSLINLYCVVLRESLKAFLISIMNCLRLFVSFNWVTSFSRPSTDGSGSLTETKNTNKLNHLIKTTRCLVFGEIKRVYGLFNKETETILSHQLLKLQENILLLTRDKTQV